MTWRHLASQTSGYGLVEKPGAAYSYNDFALALYYDTLTEKVFQQPGVDAFRQRLAGPMQFQDAISFDKPRPGRLALSVRAIIRCVFYPPFTTPCLGREDRGRGKIFIRKPC